MNLRNLGCTYYRKTGDSVKAKRRPPWAATREVFGKCNIRTFVSDKVMLAYWSVLSTLFHIKLFLKADSARRVAAHRAEPYMLIGWNSSQTGLPVKWALSALSWFEGSWVAYSTSHVQLLFRILAATLPSAVRTGLLPADGARRHPPCGMSAEKQEKPSI